jgi:hypothetical protein
MIIPQHPLVLKNLCPLSSVLKKENPPRASNTRESSSWLTFEKNHSSNQGSGFWPASRPVTVFEGFSSTMLRRSLETRLRIAEDIRFAIGTALLEPVAQVIVDFIDDSLSSIALHREDW